MMPAIMDSQGKPGIAGSTIGVETDSVVELLVVVGVLIIVIVDTEVLTMVVAAELDSDAEEALDAVELVIDADTVVVAIELELELEIELEVELEVVLVACCPTTGGIVGSRWKIPVRLFGQVGVQIGCAPTAHPSVGLVVKTEYKPNPEATGVGKFIAVHPPPFHHAVTSFPAHVGLAVRTRATLQPTAQPSPLPAGVPNVST